MPRRLNQQREKKLSPIRMETALRRIQNLGYEIIFHNETDLQFYFKDHKVNFFPYSGWHTGKTITDGRGLNKLLKQIDDDEKNS